MEEKFNYIKKRINQMEGSRGTWEDHWQEILDYVMPRKADITFKRTKGEKRAEILFDSTAITASNLLAASLQGTLTSPSLQWFNIKLMFDYIFNQAGCGRATATCNNSNERIKKLIEGVGFEQEGLMKNAMQIDNTYVDAAVYGMLKVNCKWV